MQYLVVIIAALAAYAFGAVWYMVLRNQWIAASGVETGADGRPQGRAGYVVALVGAILVAGMMRHVFAEAAIATPGKGLVSGLGIGLFLATPWIATNNSFAGRAKELTLIDGGFATIGCGLIGLVLTVF